MSSFPSIITKIDSKLQNFQKQMLSQIDDFEKKQQNLLNLEQAFEKNLQQENDKFSKKMQEKREKIQAENKIEEAISKQTSEFKRKSSIKFPQQTNGSPDYKPMIMNQRRSSSRGIKKPLKMEEMLESTLKAPKKLILNLIRGEYLSELDSVEKREPYCKFSINGKTLKSKVGETQGNALSWNEAFEIFEDFNKMLLINFKFLDKNMVKEDKLIGEGVLQLEANELKNQEFWVDIKKTENIIGKILFKLDFF